MTKIMTFKGYHMTLLCDIFTLWDAGLELSSGSRRFTSVPLSENLASRISQLAGRACAGPEIDQVVYGIISDGLHSYLDGKRTAEQAAEDINDKVNLFLNELDK